LEDMALEGRIIKMDLKEDIVKM